MGSSADDASSGVAGRTSAGFNHFEQSTDRCNSDDKLGVVVFVLPILLEAIDS